MANISNLNNTFENLNLNSKFCKLEDSKMDQYVLRKHINYSIPNYFIPKIPKVTNDIPNNSSVIPSIKQSQIEELKKLQVEIASVEEKVRELEFSKKLKLTKIDDLRCIIERIADEQCFDCVFSSRPVKNNQLHIREKQQPSKRRSSNDIVRGDSAVSTVSAVSASTTNTNGQSQEETQEAEGEGAKGGINCYPGCCCSYQIIRDPRLLIQTEDRMQMCLSYWQEYLPLPKKLSKA